MKTARDVLRLPADLLEMRDRLIASLPTVRHDVVGSVVEKLYLRESRNQNLEMVFTKGLAGNSTHLSQLVPDVLFEALI